MKLLNGDCLEELKYIADDSIDLIFGDLPYGATHCKWDCPIDLDRLWTEFMRVKKLHTPIIMTTTTKFGVSLINTAPKNCPFRYDLVFCKSTSSGFLCSSRMPLRKHEMVYVFYERLPFYDISSHIKKNNFTTPIGEEEDIHIDIAKEGAYGVIAIINPKNRKGKYETPLPHSLLEIKSFRGKYSGKGHSCQKPVELMEWILKYYSKENDIVLDATMGSGAMGVACKNMNRQFIGIEKDKEIFDGVKDRLKD